MKADNKKKGNLENRNDLKDGVKTFFFATFLRHVFIPGCPGSERNRSNRNDKE